MRRITGHFLLGLWLIGGLLATGQADAQTTSEPPLLGSPAVPPVRLPTPPPLTGFVCPLTGEPSCPVLLPPPPPPIIDPPPPVVTVKVRVAGCAPEGHELEYHICLENCSPAAAHHVILRNPLPENAKFLRANPEPTSTKPELQWKLGTMFGGERRTIVLVLAPLGTGEIKNCTRVQFEHGQCVTTRIGAFGHPHEVGPPPKIIPIPKDPTKEPSKLLLLEITGPKQQYLNVGTKYTIKVTNNSKVAATKAYVQAQVPDKLDYVSSTPKGTFQEGRVGWPLGDLEPGQSKTVEVVLKAKAAGNFCIKAEAVADPDLKAQGETCTDFRGVSALSVEMTDTTDPVVVGGETTYMILVENTGGAPASNLQIKAYFSELLSFKNAKGGEFAVGEPTKDGFNTLIFEPMQTLAAGGKMELEVTMRAMRAGDARFKIELTADQLERGPVREDESTTIFNEDGSPPLLRN